MTLAWKEKRQKQATAPLDWWFQIYPDAQDPRRKIFVTQFGALGAGNYINGSIPISVEELFQLDEIPEKSGEIIQILKELKELFGMPIFAPLVDDGISVNPETVADFDLPNRALADVPELAKDRSILVAVIDDLIPPLNRRFLRSSRDKTRFLYLWQQDRRLALDAQHLPKHVAIGQEFYAADLNYALQNAPNEAQAYRDLKLIEEGRPWLRRGDSHGAAVANIVAGTEPGKNIRFRIDKDNWIEGPPGDDVHFLGVNLHHAVVHDASGTFMQALALSAFVRLVQHITRLEAYAGSRLPVVLNFSFGLSSGAPSERTPLALAMELYVRVRDFFGAETHVLLPAGNHRQSRLLGEVNCISPGGESSFNLRATPVSGSSVQFQVEPEKGKAEFMTLKLTTPDGAYTGTAPKNVGRVSVLQDADKRPVAAIYRTVKGFYCSIAPTREDDTAGYSTAPAGYWTVSLGTSHLVQDVRVQLRRGDTPGRHRLAGEMPALCDPGYRKFLAGGGHADADGDFIRRQGTISSLAGPPSAIVVGSKTSRRYSKSSAYSGKPEPGGPPVLFEETMVDPHRSLPGLPSKGTYSNVTERLSGTSAASARKARKIICER